MRIHVLPSELANQIAAGEVVERPASVVKELLENSIDAGATKILIEIEQGGIQSIHIRDNGKGIAKEDLALALTRHATSKIQTLSDLDAVSSLGFRGEALASIVSIAHVGLTSKTPNQNEAWQIKTQDNSQFLTPEIAAHPNGTSIHVRQLFYNTPARRKFLKSVKTEFNHIDECVRRIALACPAIDISLKHQGKAIRHYKAGTNTGSDTQRLSALCGEKFVAHSAFVETEHLGLKLYGWIVDASIGSEKLTPQYMYVNGRFVRDRFLSHAVRQAYEVAEAQWCRAYVLFLEIDNNDVDVNVHPTKHEVRFTQPRRIHDFFVSVFLYVLQKPHETRSKKTISSPESRTYTPEPEATLMTLAQPRHKYQNHTGTQSLAKNTCSKQAQSVWMGLMTPEKSSATSSSTPAQTIPEPEVVDTLGATPLCMIEARYCLCQNASGFELIDIAQLDLLNQFQGNEITKHPLLMPIRFALNAIDIQRLEKHKTSLQQWGIDYKYASKNKLIITHAPAFLQHIDFSTRLPVWLEMLDNLSGSASRAAFLVNDIDIKNEMFYDLASAKFILKSASLAVIQRIARLCTHQALLEIFTHD